MYTGSPPPSCDRLDGVVNGVNASFAALGNGTEVRNDPRPGRPVDAVRLLQDRPVADDAPDQQPLGRQARVEALLACGSPAGSTRCRPAGPAP